MKYLGRLFRKNRMTEILLTTNIELYSQLLIELKKNTIRYEIKTTNMGTQNRQTGRGLGQIGENINMQIMYYVYVNKADEQKARSLISGLSQ